MTKAKKDEEYCARCYRPLRAKLVFACLGNLYCNEHCATLDQDELDDVANYGEWIRLEDIT